MDTVRYTDDCTTIPSAVLSEVLRCVWRVKLIRLSLTRRDSVSILSTAGFITSPEGEAEAVRGIFVDKEVARIV
jgi:hypothetical protein